MKNPTTPTGCDIKQLRKKLRRLTSEHKNRHDRFETGIILFSEIIIVAALLPLLIPVCAFHLIKRMFNDPGDEKN